MTKCHAWYWWWRSSYNLLNANNIEWNILMNLFCIYNQICLHYPNHIYLFIYLFIKEVCLFCFVLFVGFKSNPKNDFGRKILFISTNEIFLNIHYFFLQNTFWFGRNNFCKIFNISENNIIISVELAKVLLGLCVFTLLAHPKL